MRVEGGGRLIEDRNARPLHQHLGKAEPLPHALRERAHPGVRDGAEADALHRLGKAGVDLLARQAGEASGIGEIVERREPVIEADLVWQIADPALHLERIAQRIKTGDLGASLGRLSEAEQHQDRCRLARAVGAENADDLAGADFEIDVVDRDIRAVTLGQLLGPDDNPVRHDGLLSGGRTGRRQRRRRAARSQ